MKDLVTPVAVDEIRNVVRKCLENAALINFNKVNEMARSEGRLRLLYSMVLCVCLQCHVKGPAEFPVVWGSLGRVA